MIARWMILICCAALIAAGCDSTEDVDGGVDAGPECETASQCDDEIDCTIDLCVDGECRNSPDNEVCDDDDVCNGLETCSTVNGCQDGEPMVCDDTIGCTVDRCDVERQRCISEPDDDLCDEGYVCVPDLGGCAPVESGG